MLQAGRVEAAENEIETLSRLHLWLIWVTSAWAWAGDIRTFPRLIYVTGWSTWRKRFLWLDWRFGVPKYPTALPTYKTPYACYGTEYERGRIFALLSTVHFHGNMSSLVPHNGPDFMTFQRYEHDVIVAQNLILMTHKSKD